MKRKNLVFILFLTIVFFLCLAGWATADSYMEPACLGLNSVIFGSKCAPDGVDGPPYDLDGPAPSSGDGESDGSGFDRPSGGPKGSGSAKGHGGPPSNSGDGVPDGSDHD